MINDFFNSLLPNIQNFGIFSYWIIFLIFFAESIVFVGLIIPGAVLSIFLGALAARGVFGLGDLMVTAALGFFFGDLLSFYLGRKGTDFFKEENKILNYAHVKKGEDFFKRHGNKSVLLGKFIGFLRPLTPFIAGLSKVSLRRFLILDTLAIASWVAFHFLTGFFFGQALGLVKIWTTRAEQFLLVSAITLALFYFFKWLIFKKGQSFWLVLGALLSLAWDAVISSSHLSKLPNFKKWLEERTSTKKFAGLPMTLLSLVFILIFLKLSLLSADILSSNLTVLSDDNRFESLMYSLRSSVFIKLFLIITSLGKIHIIVAFAFGFALMLLLNRKYLYASTLWLSIIGSSLSVSALKFLIHRPRPSQGFYIEPSFSFPSGHATLSVAFYGFMLYYFLRKNQDWSKKINRTFGVFLLILIIGFSRLYLGVHYLSDVLAGYALGGLWLLLAVFMVEFFKSPKEKKIEPMNQKLHKFIVAGIILAELITFISFNYYNRKINLNRIQPLPLIATSNIVDTINNYDLPKYSETLDGDKLEPLNFIVSADNDQHLVSIFEKLGWYRPDKPSIDSISKTLKTTALNKNYPEAPIAPAFWQAEVNDLAFEKPTEKNSVRQRHHAKFWRTNFRTPNGKTIYFGTIGLDIGVNWWVAHKIDPNVDAEREYFFNELKNNKLFASWSREHGFVEPIQQTKKFSGPFYTDGNIYIVDLK